MKDTLFNYLNMLIQSYQPEWANYLDNNPEEIDKIYNTLDSISIEDLDIVSNNYKLLITDIVLYKQGII